MSGRRRALDDVAATLRRWCRHRWPDRPGLDVLDVQRASAGHANETLFVRLSGAVGPTGDELVVRLPPLVASFPDRDPLAEGRLLDALAAAALDRLPVPAPVAIEEDAGWFGAPFLVLPRVPGRAPGEVLVADEWLVAGGEPLQATLHRGFVDVLAALHRLDPAAVVGAAGGAPLGREVERWRSYLAWAAGDDPVDPGLAEAMAWVVANQPMSEAEPAPSLTWGDARLGNLLVDEGTAEVVAVLDWELAAVGPAELDLGWYLALDELQARFVGATLPGFPDRDGMVAAWEAAVGRPARDLAWHEVFALVRSTAIHDRQTRVAVAAGEAPAYGSGDANPLVAWVLRKIERLAAG